MADYSIFTRFVAKDDMSSPLMNSIRSVNNLNKSINRVGTRVLQVGLTGLAASVTYFVSEASKIENATAAFTPLLGGVSKATELVEMLNKEAATTPFAFEGIAKIAQQLLPVMNRDLKLTTETFRMLGDTAGGKIDKLETITRGYTKALLKGKPDMESLNMIAEAGVPIFTEMAASMGISVKQLFQLSKEGKLTNKNLTDTFKKMTSEGGLFFKGMEISSATFSGVMSTMKDNIALAAASIGKSLLPPLKEFMQYIIKIVPKVTEWANENKDLIATKMKSFLDGLIVAAKFIYTNFDTIVVLFKVFIPILVAFKIAMIALNIVMYANPAGLIVLGVILLIGVITVAIVKFDEWGASILMLLGPIGWVINAIVIFAKHWDNITSAFTDGGFVAGLKEIGKTLLDMLLMPLQQILSIAESITGMDLGSSAIEKFRSDFGISVDNPDAASKRVDAKIREEYWTKTNNNNSTQTLEISDKTKNKDLNFTMPNLSPSL
jgi:tape measure domain-containing protein